MLVFRYIIPNRALFDFIADNENLTFRKEQKSVSSLMEKENSKTNNVRIDKEVPSTNDLISDFALYVRMYSQKRRFYETILIQSMRYFWTIKAPLVVVLDNTAEDKTFGKEISQVYPYPEICHEEPYNSTYYHGKGHVLQQLSMFHAEKCFSRKYVGIVDTDTMFVTMVTPDQLFVDGKPVIIGQFGSAADQFWYEVSTMTEVALGRKEVFRCMSYFPVMIKVTHLAEMRAFMAKLHQMDFNSVFRKLTAKPFSQFSIMCNYLWYFHRDEYTFHAQLRPSTGVWKGEYTSPARHGVAYYKENIPEKMMHPVTRATIHYKYMNNWYKVDTYRRILKLALCHSGGFDVCPQMCKAFDRNAIFKDLFLFEFSDWTWDKRCIVAQRNHSANIDKLNKTETTNRILLGCQEVDILPFKL